MQGRPLDLLDFDGTVGQHPLDGLVVGNRLAKGFSLTRVVHPELQQPLRLADGSRGDRQAPTADPLHRQAKAVANFAQNVAGRHAHVVEPHVGRFPTAHQSDRPLGPAHVTVDEKRGDAAARFLLGSVTAKTMAKSAS